MISLFGLCDILMYGNVADGILEVQEDFQLQLNKSDNNDDCMVITLNACYIGEKAPTIKFSLLVNSNAENSEILYESHEYNIGLKEEFSVKEWRRMGNECLYIFSCGYTVIGNGTFKRISASH